MRRPIPSIAKAAIIALFSGACSHESTPKQSDTLVAASGAPAARDSKAPSTGARDSSLTPPFQASNDSLSEPLSCAPDTLGAGDTLTLSMKTPHGDYLTVTPPNGPVHFIVYPQFGIPRRRYSLIPSEDFRRVAVLRLPSDIRAIARVRGRDTIPEPVFTDAGKYLLRMGENLESDYGNRNYTCPLVFVQKSK